MFKEPPITNTPETDTIVGPSVKIEGDFFTEGNIIVEGTICGTLRTSKNLKAGQRSKLFANVSAENALIAGEVQGNMKIRGKLEITTTGKIYGDVKVGTLIIAAGSVLNGKCQMGNEKEKTDLPNPTKQEKIILEEDEEEIKIKALKRK